MTYSCDILELEAYSCDFLELEAYSCDILHRQTETKGLQNDRLLIPALASDPTNPTTRDLKLKHEI